jgi:hypothetical protein
MSGEDQCAETGWTAPPADDTAAGAEQDAAEPEDPATADGDRAALVDMELFEDLI